MSAMVILPSSIHHPRISTLKIGSHFMCECCPGEGRGYMAVYQIINYDSDTSTHTNKVPAVNCSTGFVHLFSPDAKVIPAKMVLAPQDMVNIDNKDVLFAQ